MVAEVTFWPILAVLLAALVVAAPLFGTAAIAACVAVCVRTGRKGRQ